jgi:hypothetical protein
MDIDGGSESVASMDEMPVDETAPFDSKRPFHAWGERAPRIRCSSWSARCFYFTRLAGIARRRSLSALTSGLGRGWCG